MIYLTYQIKFAWNNAKIFFYYLKSIPRAEILFRLETLSGKTPGDFWLSIERSMKSIKRAYKIAGKYGSREAKQSQIACRVKIEGERDEDIERFQNALRDGNDQVWFIY